MQLKFLESKLLHHLANIKVCIAMTQWIDKEPDWFEKNASCNKVIGSHDLGWFFHPPLDVFASLQLLHPRTITWKLTIPPERKRRNMYQAPINLLGSKGFVFGDYYPPCTIDLISFHPFKSCRNVRPPPWEDGCLRISEMEGFWAVLGVKKKAPNLWIIFLYTLYYVYIDTLHYYTLFRGFMDWCPCQHFWVIRPKIHKGESSFFCCWRVCFFIQSKKPQPIRTKSGDFLCENGWLDFKFLVEMVGLEFRQPDLRVKTWLGNSWIPMDISLKFVGRTLEIWHWDWRLKRQPWGCWIIRAISREWVGVGMLWLTWSILNLAKQTCIV